MMNMFDTITEQKDVVESVLIILLFVFSLFRNTSVEWSDVVLIVLSGVILFSTLRHILNYSRRKTFVRKRCRRAVIYLNMSSEKKNRLIHDLLDGYPFHPAAYAALKCYVENMLFDEFFSPKEK